MKKRVLFLFLVGVFLFSLSMDREGKKTVWDFSVKGVFIKNCSSQLVKKALRFGFKDIFIPYECEMKEFNVKKVCTSPLRGCSLLVFKQFDCDIESKTKKEIEKCFKLKRKIAKNYVKFLKNRLIFLPFFSSPYELYFKTGLTVKQLDSSKFILSYKKFSWIKKENFIIVVSETEGIESKILSAFSSGIDGFVLWNFSEIPDEELYNIGKIIGFPHGIRLNSKLYLDVPVRYQKTDYFCGPAVSQMLFLYLKGKKVSQFELAKIMKTKGPTAGTRPVEIEKFLKENVDIGYFQYEGFSHEIIEKNIKHGFPVIARVKTSYLRGWKGAYGHYILIKGISKDYYYVNDPVKGSVFYSKKEIEKAVVNHYYGPLLIVRFK